MNQKFALVLAGVLTAFFVLMVGSIVTLIVAQPLVAQTNVAQSVQAQQIPEQPVLSGQTNVAASTLSPKLNPDQAVQIAMTTVPRSTLATAPELVSYQGIVAYEVKLDRATLYIDANTGKVLANSATVLSPTTASNRGGEHEEHEEKAHD